MDTRERIVEADPATPLGDPEWCPEGRFVRARARERILESCLELSRGPRLASRNLFIVQNVVFEGRSVEEIAERVGLRRSGVSSLLARLRRRIEESAGRLGRPAAPATAVAEPGSGYGTLA